MMRKRTWLVLAALIALAVLLWPKTATQQTPSPAPSATQTARTVPTPGVNNSLPAFLPPEARDMVATIQRGGPFAHRQDGNVFGNREGLLPDMPRGHYREYTIATPGVEHRGARRIVTGGHPPRSWFYTDDHYDSFRAFNVRAPERRQ